MKKTFVWALLCLMGNGLLFAQIKDFDLSQYKLPYLKRHSLYGSFNLGSNYYSTKDDLTEYTSKNLSYDCNVLYKNYFNSTTFQGEQSVNVSYSFDNRNVKTISSSENKSMNKSLDLNLNIMSVNRYYSDDFFYGFGITCSANRIVYEEDYSGNNKDETTIATNGSLPLFIGLGRIEQVEDARLAVYILDELSTAGSLAHQPTNDEVLEFAKLISELKNERFFDGRLKKISELQQVVSFLKTHNLLVKDDIQAFAIVNDNWDYAQGPQRASGSRLTFSIAPSWDYRKSSNKQTNFLDYVSKTKKLSGAIGVEYCYEKPVSLLWQRTLKVTTGFSFGKSTYEPSENFSVDSDVKDYFISLETGIGYYPNSRTNFNFSLSGAYSKDFNNSDADSEGDYFLLAPTIRAYYYISPQLRLTFEDRLNMTWMNRDYENFVNDSKRDNIDNFFNLKLEYSFF